jgi:Domain of unknown function (DUF4252)
MKTILRPTCALAVASLLFAASLRAADAPAGLVNFGKFTKPTNGELVEINLTSDMIAMAMQLAGKGQPDFTEALSGLHSISVNVVGMDDQNREEVMARMKAVRAQLDAGGWQPVVKVQEKKEDVGIYLKTRGKEAIEGVVITVIEGRKQAVFINVAGNIQMDKLSALGDKLNIKELKKVAGEIMKQTTGKKEPAPVPTPASATKE